MHKKTNQNKGRSMVEMLGVLAIIGVLSIAGISGYKMAINKHRANNILHDASLGLADIGTTEKISSAWKDVSFTPSSGLSVQIKKHENGEDLAKVEGVPSGACEVLLEYKGSENITMIYGAENEDAETEAMKLTELTECADEDQTMIFSFTTGTDSDLCAGKTCSGHGTCKAGVCTCSGTYIGDNCETDKCADVVPLENCSITENVLDDNGCIIKRAFECDEGAPVCAPDGYTCAPSCGDDEALYKVENGEYACCYAGGIRDIPGSDDDLQMCCVYDEELYLKTYPDTYACCVGETLDATKTTSGLCCTGLDDTPYLKTYPNTYDCCSGEFVDATETTASFCCEHLEGSLYLETYPSTYACCESGKFANATATTESVCCTSDQKLLDIPTGGKMCCNNFAEAKLYLPTYNGTYACCYGLSQNATEDQDGACCTMTIDNCSVYNADCTCKTCENGYTVSTDSKSCTATPTCTTINQCSAYNTDCTCKTCESGYALSSDGKTCCMEIDHCSTYTASSGVCTCTACESPYVVITGNCGPQSATEPTGPGEPSPFPFFE